jgi:phytanoyl-CoA hydroxylase
MTIMQMDSNPSQPYASSLYAAGKVANVRQKWDDLDVHHYEQDGFFALNHALTHDQVQDANAGLTALIQGDVAGYDQIQFEKMDQNQIKLIKPDQRVLHVRRLFSFCKFESRLHAIMHDPNIIQAVGKLLGDREPICFQEMALLKPPMGREKPWHQDHAYFNLALGEPVVGVWIALDDATIENGCMHVLPGSHRDGARVHFKRRDWQLCDTDIIGQSITAVPLDAGGLMFFDGLLHHGTPQNLTTQRRRALQFHYCAIDANWTDEQARLAVFGSEGKDVSC